MAPTVGEMLISLSLSTMSSRVPRWPMSLSASNERPVMSAASPTTTAIRSWRAAHVARQGEALADGDARCRRGRRRTRRGGSRCAAGSRPCRPSGAASGSRPGGRSAACGRTPGGRCPTRCGRSGCRAADAARPSAPRRPSELPRWPPVSATVLMMVWRISSHSCGSCSSESACRSWGPRIPGRMANAFAPVLRRTPPRAAPGHARPRRRCVAGRC